MKNENGTTLVEVAATILIITIVTTMVITSIMACFSLNLKTLKEYGRVSGVYDDIEMDTVDPEWKDTVEGSITFTVDGYPITITGNYEYDNVNNKLGEFIGD